MKKRKRKKGLVAVSVKLSRFNILPLESAGRFVYNNPLMYQSLLTQDLVYYMNGSF